MVYKVSQGSLVFQERWGLQVSEACLVPSDQKEKLVTKACQVCRVFTGLQGPKENLGSQESKASKALLESQELQGPVVPSGLQEFLGLKVNGVLQVPQGFQE